MLWRDAQRFAVGATVVALAFGTQAWAENAAQPAEATGAWRIEAAPNADAQQENFSLVTSAIDSDDALFGLWRQPAVPLYYFALRDARSSQPSGTEVTLTLRYADQEPVRWQAEARGDGHVVVKERVHQTAFTLILTSLRQTTASTVELA